MRVHYLQHVPFEDLGSLQAVFDQHNMLVGSTKLYANEPLPSLDEFDWLIIMGGPMGVYDEDQYPWLHAEKIIIKQAIEKSKVVLGICLGAQLIAAMMGAEVTSNLDKEIGWHTISPPPLGTQKTTLLSPIFERSINAFHWHGDTFSLPNNAILLASSKACVNQAFSIEDRIFGFQFHLETSNESAQALIRHCNDDITAGAYVQDVDMILANPQYFSDINRIMANVINTIIKHHA